MSHTIDKVGERFERELVRRFHCGGRYATASSVNQRLDQSTSNVAQCATLDATGEAFDAELLRRFHHDDQYRELP